MPTLPDVRTLIPFYTPGEVAATTFALGGRVYRVERPGPDLARVYRRERVVEGSVAEIAVELWEVFHFGRVELTPAEDRQ